jgi:hypothetical protein
MTKLFVFVPAFGRQITSSTFEATHLLMAALFAKGIEANIGTFSWPDIEEVRNFALTYWYDAMPAEFTHMLFVDADVGFEANMVLDMIAFGEPVVGATYPKKTLPISWVGSGLPDHNQRGGFLEVEGLGFGCVLIRRDAIPPMIERFPEKIYPTIPLPQIAPPGMHRTLGFFDCMRVPEGKVSEDIAFCKRYRETGGKVWMSTAYTTSHEGSYLFADCFARSRAATAKKARDAETAKESA